MKTRLLMLFSSIILITMLGLLPLTHGQYMGNIDPPHTLEECIGCGIHTRTFPPPLKQTERNNVLPENILCNIGLELIIKSDYSAACVKPETATKLVERGWATTVIIAHESMKSKYENKILLSNGQYDYRIEYVVPWLMMSELNEQGITNWKNNPSTEHNADDGFRNPSKICSSILLDSAKIYVSSIFYSIHELKVTNIIIDGLEPKHCQKWYHIPHHVDAQNSYLLNN